MRLNKTLACLPMLAATAAFAGGNNYHWDSGHRRFNPWHDTNLCKLQIVDIYQPEGGSQPIHLRVKNLTKNRLKYNLSMTVNGQDAGTFDVTNVNPDETTERDGTKRYNGTLGNSIITVRVTNCGISS